jgi:hypothetical protein
MGITTYFKDRVPRSQYPGARRRSRADLPQITQRGRLKAAPQRKTKIQGEEQFFMKNGKS